MPVVKRYCTGTDPCTHVPYPCTIPTVPMYRTSCTHALWQVYLLNNRKLWNSNRFCRHFSCYLSTPIKNIGTVHWYSTVRYMGTERYIRIVHRSSVPKPCTEIATEIAAESVAISVAILARVLLCHIMTLLYLAKLSYPHPIPVPTYRTRTPYLHRTYRTRSPYPAPIPRTHVPHPHPHPHKPISVPAVVGTIETSPFIALEPR